MSRPRPSATVVRAAMFAAAAPVSLLVALAAWVVARRLEPVVVLAASAGVAAWGARAGVLASGRRGGVLRRGVVRVARLTALLVLAAVVRIVSSGTPPAGVVGLPLVVPGALLVGSFLVGRTVGRVLRRQVDPLTTPGAHRSADAALLSASVTGVAVVLGCVVLAHSVDGAPLPARWVPLAWLVVAVAAVVSTRPVVLRARTGTTAGAGWPRSLVPVLGLAVVLVAGIGLVLAAGLELQLRTVLPALPTWQLGLFDRVADAGQASPARWRPPTPGVAWQIALLVTVALLLTVGRFAHRRRRRRPGPPGVGMSLRMLLRLLLRSGRPGRSVDDDELDATDPPTGVAVSAGSSSPAPAWLRHLRPRPRDPAAAILHDYRLVQRRLPAGRRRRPSETVLAHADREHAEELAELGAMVCAIRFAQRAPSAADAERSRLLARRLIRG